jgi:hypothetical protein
MSIDSKGRVLLAGTYYGPTGNQFAVARFNPDGSADPGFGAGGWLAVDFGAGARGLALDPQGRILLAGLFSNPNTSSEDIGLARLLPPDEPYAAAGLTVAVNNVAPTATLSNNGPVTYGAAFTVSISNPFDPSAADTAAGFHYAYSLDPSALASATYASGSGTSSSQACSLAAGTYTVYARIIDADNGYTQYQTTVTVDPATLTVTAANQSRVYGDADPAFTASYSGFQNGETLATSGVGGSPSLTSADTATSPVGSYAITAAAGTLSAANYTFAFVSGALTVGQAIPAYSGLAAPAITYGDGSDTLSGVLRYVGTGATVVPSGAVLITANGVSEGATINPDGSFSAAFDTHAWSASAAGYTVTFHYAGDGNFQAPADGAGPAVVVGKATLTVTADNQSKTYGDSNPTLSASYSGFKNSDTFTSGVTGSPGLATSAGLYSPVGSYPITVGAGSLGAHDYIFTFVGGTLAVIQAATATALTASAATARFGVGTVTFTAGVTASAPGSGTVTGSVDFYDTTTGTDLGTAPVVNGTASLSTGALAVGKHAITATYGGDGNFRASASAAATVQVFFGYAPGVFDSATATWYLRNGNSAGPADAGSFAYGAPGWTPVAGDWNGDGRTTIGVVDPATMTWYLRNENSAGPADVAAPFRFGLPGWIPVVGDWGGTGHAGIGAFDPSTATWYLRNEASPGRPDAGVFRYGGPGWIPVVGDWDGNGTTTVGVVNPNGPGGTLQWFLRNGNSAGAPDIGPFSYGLSGWKPVTGDWAAPGKTTIGVVAPANDTWFLRTSNTPGSPDITPFAYGGPGWTPVSGNWAGPAATALTAAESRGVSNNLVADLLATEVRRTRALDQVFASGGLGLV